GGAYIMETEHGMVLPRRLQIEFSRAVQHATEDTGTEISPAEMWRVFSREYLPEHAPIELVAHETATAGDRATVVAHLRVRGDEVTVTGEGNGADRRLRACPTRRTRDRARRRRLQRARRQRGRRRGSR